MYHVGSRYTRNDIYEILQIPLSSRGGDWLNGYHRHGRDFYIFCNIGAEGRTGHDYPNLWNGPILIWHGKNRSNFKQKTIQKLISGEYRVLIFYRENNRDPFKFAGIGYPRPYPETSDPARIDWLFTNEPSVEP